MNFRTQITLKKQADNLIDYSSNILLVGSCFSNNIGNKLMYFGFNSLVNPFGVLFNPKVIERFFINSVSQKEFLENDVFYHNERWHCFDAHSCLSSKNKNKLLKNLNTAINKTFKKLQHSTHIIITLGTAWTYRFLKENKVVSSCHKIPQKYFLKEILQVSEIVEILTNISRLISKTNKNITVIYTISPVKHLKDGFVENSQSKSHLISAVHYAVSQNNNSFYFPSYEIMTDELRDYRFYDNDMVHPNKTAIDYIWGKFSKVWVHPKAEKTMCEVDAVKKGLAHKPFDENSKKHKLFKESLQHKITKLKNDNPNINMSF